MLHPCSDGESAVTMRSATPPTHPRSNHHENAAILLELPEGMKQLELLSLHAESVVRAHYLPRWRCGGGRGGSWGLAVPYLAGAAAA